ncbi:gephyrin-like molybdotransferase Glp [Paenibacillus allorhizosphaerae]|uniref:Molybdopterin molybdenumtransferase n=1 Tax=Paenibacillus allorhizosphaerae TaxID=2849866 RepID=A0ABM8VLT9_9BACL|nr:gephyrin-like molybdotransferase Glp [Paenibacillus allorhizosphaerae]CAG7648957.1 Molybdopterin molybdenumtransferase [Paenibacillus allorhizosphaerae]
MGNLKFGRETIRLEEAQARVLRFVRRMEKERVPLTEAAGRRLAEEIRADHPVPHFRRSGVDGYALHAEDTAGASGRTPVRFEVTETIPCGVMPQHSLGRGQAARIMTGAVVPEGADAVVMLEMTDRLERDERTEESDAAASVGVLRAMMPGENISPIGQEVAEGETLLPGGRKIGPGEAAILATFGYSHVPVFKKPKVAIFSTGFELLPVEASLRPGLIRNSNSYMLACQVTDAGGEPTIMPALPDDPGKVQSALAEALEWADVLITTGGVSVGDKDVLVELFAQWDGELHFNKIEMRPGSPTSFGCWQGKPLFALSGNPGASYVGFELLARPYLRAALGSSDPLPQISSACLDADYRKGSAYPRYVRGTSRVEQGMVKVKPAGRDQSSIMISIKDADCLILIPAGGQGAQAGALVTTISLMEK